MSEQPISEANLAEEQQEKPKQEKPTSVKKEVLSWVMTFVAAILIVVFAQTFLIINAQVPTGSMVNTIQEGDRIFTFRLSYLFDDPQRGDIIVFRYPDNEKERFTKRVIGLPGERVEIRDGKVYINDSETPLDEPYVNGTPTGNFGPYEVPEDCYFMLGDNRNDSLDARYWQNTYLHKDKIWGKVIFSYYPDFKWLNERPDYGEFSGS